MLREIGSNFWLNPNVPIVKQPIGSPEQFRCKGSDYVWLSTGRSAIMYAIKTIEQRHPKNIKIAVLPAFTCDTVFAPFLNAGYKIYYYSIEQDLTTATDTIRKTVIEHDASIVLFHRYFGFDTLDSQINSFCDEMRQLGNYTIEDCTQCLYSDFNRAKADFFVGSIRKWTGTPDGGFAVCRKGVFETKPQIADKLLENAKVKASYTKYRFLFEDKGTKAEVLSLYREAEDILDNQVDFYSISETSSKIQGALDVNELKKKRRHNFRILQDSLHAPVKKVFSIDNGQEVPLYFPILVEDRDSLQKHLIQNAIYAPVVWPKSYMQPKVCDSVEYFYQHLLCIPIDQRYGVDDMHRIVEVIHNFY